MSSYTHTLRLLDKAFLKLSRHKFEKFNYEFGSLYHGLHKVFKFCMLENPNLAETVGGLGHMDAERVEELMKQSTFTKEEENEVFEIFTRLYKRWDVVRSRMLENCKVA